MVEEPEWRLEGSGQKHPLRGVIPALKGDQFSGLRAGLLASPALRRLGLRVREGSDTVTGVGGFSVG